MRVVMVMVRAVVLLCAAVVAVDCVVAVVCCGLLEDFGTLWPAADGVPTLVPGVCYSSQSPMLPVR